VELVSLNDLLKRSDFITFNVPLNNKTKNLLNFQNSKLLKKNSIIINLSRGGVVNESVLYKLLKKKLIFGAATDVFLHEKKRNKLFKLNNVVVTPHIGAMTFDTQKIIANEVFKKVTKLLN
jgi:D-3-phosphoglycerate dehydrogenase